MFESLRNSVDLTSSKEEKVNRLRTMVKNLGIKVEFSAGFSTEASYSGKAIKVMHPDYLEEKFDMTAREAEISAIYLLLHEVSHAMYSNSDPSAYLGKLRDKYSPLGYDWPKKLFICVDALEDAIVDNRLRASYRGAREYQELGNALITKALIGGGGRDNPILSAMSDWQLPDAKAPAVDPKIQKQYQSAKEIIRGTVNRNLYASSTNPADVEKESIELYHVLYGEPELGGETGAGERTDDTKSDETKSEGGTGHGKGTGTADEGTETDGCKGDKDESGDGDAKSGGTKPDTEERTDADGDVCNEGTDEGYTDDDGYTDTDDDSDEESTYDADEDFRHSDGDVEDGDDSSKSTGTEPSSVLFDMTKLYEECEKTYAKTDSEGRSFKLTGYRNEIPYYAYEEHPHLKGGRALYKMMEKTAKGAEDIQVAYGRTKDVENKPKGYKAAPQTENMAKDITRRLKTIIQHESSAYSCGHRNGALDTKALVKISANNSTVFKQKDEKQEGGVAVMILLDASGSMSGTVQAVSSMAYAIAQGLMNNKISVKVVSHTTTYLRGGAVQLICHKDWDEKNLEGLYAYKAQSDNRDDVAIYLSGIELALRPEEKKLLIVLSDGQPSDTISKTYSGLECTLRGATGVGACKHVIRNLRISGIRTVGVFWTYESIVDAIGAKNHYIVTNVAKFKEMYGDDFMMCSTSDWTRFPARLTRAVDTVFKR